MDPTKYIRFTAIGRTAKGAMIVLAPGRAAEHRFGGAGAGRSLVRAMGGRDVVLGGLTLALVGNGPAGLRRAALLTRLGVGFDVADAAASLLAWKTLGGRRWRTAVTVIGALGSAAPAWSATRPVLDDSRATR